MSKRGQFVVLEGNNGLGKTTQAHLLDQYLTQENIPHRLYCFPRYDSFFGKLAAAFLHGEHGSVESTSPYFVALTFANDRLLVRDEIRAALAEGLIVVADRWVSSNLAVQASKFANEGERETFNRWVQELEYDVFQQPQPDLTIYLRARPEISIRNLLKRGRADIEESTQMVRASFTQYERLAADLPNWVLLDLEPGAPEGEILSIAVVHSAIISQLQKAHVFL
ncbi:MAG TPA: deoxynucleoside kinase [Phototrophicaceae bacterium]|nr:deoxynucleoside kinase [Phototrophicaceae bacterium]